MRTAPPLTRALSYPVTTGIGLMAAVVTLLYLSGRSIDAFTMSSVAYDDEPWRLLSSALPHGDPLHLLFNLFWWWIFATHVEEVHGPVKAFALAAVLAIGASAAEFALVRGGIGLSGVGYGLFGYILVLSRFDRRFRGVIDRRLALMFGGWFVLCIVLTLADVWSIGNVAHGAGFVLGATIALAVAPLGGLPRAAGALGTAVVLAGAVASGAVWRGEVNFSSRAGADDAWRGWRAVDEQRWDDAIRHLERALAVEPGDAASWVNYGIALENVPDHPGIDGATPLDCYQRAVALDPIDAIAYWNLGRIHDGADQRDHAKAAFARAAQLDPASYSDRYRRWLEAVNADR